MSVATVRATPSRRPAAGTAQARRPRLEVVARQHGQRRRRVASILAIGIVLLSLLCVVVGHTLLAQGQISLGQIDAQLSTAQARNSATVLRVAALETPSRIQSEASSLKLVQPAQVLQLPAVSLSVPLPSIQIGTTAPSSASGAG